MRAWIIAIALLFTAGVATPDSGAPAADGKQAETAAGEQAKDESETGQTSDSILH